MSCFKKRRFSEEAFNSYDLGRTEKESPNNKGEHRKCVIVGYLAGSVLDLFDCV